MKKLKSGLAIIVSFVLLFGIGLPGAKLGVVEAAPPILATPNDTYYGEKSGGVPVISALTLDGNGVFSGGYMRIALQNARPGEQLALDTIPAITSAEYGEGTVSLVGDSVTASVYLGTGDGAKKIGNVNLINDGSSTGYEIAFDPLDEAEAHEVGASDFNDWQPNESVVDLGGLASKTQGAAVTPEAISGGQQRINGSTGGAPYSFISDVAYTKEGTDRTDTLNPDGFTAQFSNVEGALELGMGNDSQISFSKTDSIIGSAFGPEAYSPEFTVGAWDVLAFDWRAKAGGDHYEVYGFLVDGSGGNTELMYGRGQEQDQFVTAYGAVTASGDYKFRFVSGSHDYTDGGKIGATMFIKNVRYFKHVPNDNVLEQIADLVRYENTESIGDLDESEKQRTITVEVQNINGPAERDNTEFNIQLEPQLVLEHVTVADANPTQATLIFNLPVNGALEEEDFIGFTVNGYPIAEVVAPIDGNEVTVILGGPIGPGEIEVQYSGAGHIPSNTAPDNILKPIGEGEFVGEPTDNGVTPLILDEVIIDGENPDTATLDFNKPVGGAGLQEGQPIPGFAIGGKPVKVITIGVDGDLSKVVVEIAEPYEPGDAVTYTPEDGEGIEEDINSNNKLGPIDADDDDSQPGRTVEEDQLILVSAIVNDDTPDRVTLTFNRPVDDATIDWSGFSVNGYNIVGKISANDNDNTIVLQLAESLGAGDLNVLYNDEAPSKVGTYFNPNTNLLGEITGANPPATALNNVIALELIKVTTVLDEPNQLRLKFNMPISAEALTPEEAIAGFLIGADKPVSFVSINDAGDEMIVSLEEPYDANDQISYDSTEGNIADADNPNNKLGMLAGSTIPLISGKLEGIELANGGEAVEMAPAFNPNNNEGYVAVVPNEVTSVSVEPSLYNPDETFTKVYLGDTLINPVDGSWDNVGELQEGPNVITVQVFDKEDLELPVEEQTVLAEYKITIIRATGKLASLVPSDGTLAPAFDAENEGVYEVGVSYSVSDIQLTPTAIDPGATITMSINGGAAIEVENGAASADMALKVGLNTIVVTVTDSDNQTKTYTVEVRRADYPYVPVTPPKQTITIDVVIGGDNEADIVKVDIERTTQPNGKITDQVTFTPEKAKESAEKAEATGETIARMMIPDPEDKVSEINVDVTKETLKILQENGLDLEIYSDHGVIQLPHSSMSGLEEEFYFRLVPVRDPDQRSEVEERARTERIVREMAGDNTIDVVTRPMTIETNLPSRPVTLVLPLRDVMLPTDAEEREAFLNELSIFIEHSDGDKELVKGQPVTMLDGELGLQFSITKFSTFTIVHADAAVESHDKYINGFPDGTFRPERGLTRAQLATILVNLEAAGNESGVGYPDVPADHWAADAIKRVQAAGLMEGYPDGTFRPERVLTRAEMATFAFNFLQLAEASDKLYPDVEVSHWAHDIISALTQEGLIGGYPDGSFQPEKDLSRAEAVSLINRLFDRGPLFGVSGSSWSDVMEDHWAFHDIMEASLDHDYKVRAEGGELLVSN